MNHPPCPHCGGPVARRDHEHPSKHAARTYCSRECYRGAASLLNSAMANEQIAARHAQLIEDVEWLLGTDSITSIARRLGYDNPLSLHRQLERLGRWDLARHFDKVAAA